MIKIDVSYLGTVLSCPFKGYIKVLKQKAAEIESSAIDAGHFCHECYALTRLWCLYVDLVKENIEFNKINDVKFMIEQIIKKELKYDELEYKFAYTLLNDFMCYENYKEKENEKKRTLSNIRNAILEFISMTIEDMKTYKIYNDKFIGVEHHFNEEFSISGNKINFFGTIDGVYQHRETNQIILVENKTASSLTDAYLMQYDNNYQVSAYMFVMRKIYNLEVNYAMMQVHTLPINTFKIARKSVEYSNQQEVDFLNVIKNAENICNTKLLNKSSCFDFFRICEFFDICSLKNEKEREEAINELKDNEWIKNG